MKKMMIILTLLTLTLSFAIAQDGVLDATATVAVTPLSFTANTDIAVGDVVKGTNGVVDPTTGAAHTGNTGTITVGNIQITGEEGALIDLAFNSTATLENAGAATMSFAINAIGHATTQPASGGTLTTGDDVNLSGTLGAGGSGTYNIWVGGTLTVGASQSPGAYSTATGGGVPLTVVVTYL
ncbi:MAG: DUF4402 domain-containing protein [Candidatus Marinimicrobia bacterium]|nr:DUF4402 domain-containing protein [Candidatus Neomarinimicrobiota bacterium]